MKTLDGQDFELRSYLPRFVGYTGGRALLDGTKMGAIFETSGYLAKSLYSCFFDKIGDASFFGHAKDSFLQNIPLNHLPQKINDISINFDKLKDNAVLGAEMFAAYLALKYIGVPAFNWAKEKKYNQYVLFPHRAAVEGAVKAQSKREAKRQKAHAIAQNEANLAAIEAS